MELIVYNINGQKTTRKVKLNESVFGIEPNDHAIYLDAKRYMASQRQGTSSSKERGYVVGSTRKIKRQKGTGTARAGSIKSPVFRGGGRVFGPLPKDHSFKLNKKVKKLARKSALSYKVKENGITVLEDFSFEEPKTRNYVEMLNNFKLGDKKTLLIVPDADNNLLLASRNLKLTRVMKASDINTYDILNANNLLISESSVKEIEEILA